VREVFVDGIRYEVAAPPSARAAAGGGAPAQVAGAWAMTLQSPQGPMELTLTFQQSGASLAGSMASMMGNTAIDEGQVNGQAVAWTTTIQMGGQSITLNFQGQVEGTRMKGNATLGTFGSATFTAEKKP
ncbi:MAG: hypothetical protein IT352_01140, partial [Gemmatimonadales bacterium]|nr:hypothetical protein [Gemmatimonadales bacterium]